MQSLPIYLNVDGHVATPVDAYNAVRSTPPALMRGVRALLCLRLVDDEGNPDDAGIAALTSWEFVLAGDWNTSTTPEIRVTLGIAVVSTTVGTKTYNEIQIPLTELNTEELISKLGNNPSADLGAELVGFEAGETDPGFLIQFTMRVYNRRSTAGTGTPTPVDDGLYSAVQIDSLLTQYYTSVQVDEKLTGYALTTHNHDGIYAATVHSHALGDVTGLMAELDAKASAATVEAHHANTENPHAVTKTQVGLGNVDNTSDADKPVSTATQTALNLKANAADISGDLSDLTDSTGILAAKAAAADLSAHTGNTANPHAVTKTQVGLGNVDNTSDADKPVSTATQTALNGKAALGLTANAEIYFGVSGKPSVCITGVTGTGATATATVKTGETVTGLAAGDVMVIDGTTNYNGEITVATVSATEITFASAQTATESGLTEAMIRYKQTVTAGAIQTAINAASKNLNSYTLSLYFYDGYYDFVADTVIVGGFIGSTIMLRALSTRTVYPYAVKLSGNCPSGYLGVLRFGNNQVQQINVNYICVENRAATSNNAVCLASVYNTNVTFTNVHVNVPGNAGDPTTIGIYAAYGTNRTSYTTHQGCRYGMFAAGCAIAECVSAAAQNAPSRIPIYGIVSNGGVLISTTTNTIPGSTANVLVFSCI